MTEFMDRETFVRLTEAAAEVEAQADALDNWFGKYGSSLYEEWSDFITKVEREIKVPNRFDIRTPMRHLLPPWRKFKFSAADYTARFTEGGLLLDGHDYHDGETHQFVIPTDFLYPETRERAKEAIKTDTLRRVMDWEARTGGEDGLKQKQIKDIDAEIAKLQKRKEGLMTNG